MKKWSIRLGFNGNINPAFENKYKKAIRVRKQIKIELIYSVIFACLFTVLYPIVKLDSEIATNIAKIILIGFVTIACCSALAHANIIIEYKHHDDKMENEYIANVMNNGNKS